MRIKMPAGIAQTETSVTKEKANGKKLILQKISWRNHVRIGWKQKEINQKKQHRKRNIIMKRRRL